MNRRTLLGRLVAVAGVAALAPSVVTAEASEPACADCARLFAGAAVLPAELAPPSPEGLESARRAIHARAMLGDVSHAEVAQWVYWQDFPSYRIVETADPDRQAEPFTWPLEPQTYAPLTFEAMQADCAARGCNLESQYNVGRLWTEVAHWLDGQTWADDTMTMAGHDLAPVDAWRRSLHDG